MKLKDAANSQELEDSHEEVKEQITLINQVLASMRAVAAEMAGVVKKRKLAAEKAQEKKKNEELKVEGEKAEKEKKRLQKHQKMDAFRLDFAAAQLPAAQCFEPGALPKLSSDEYLRPFLAKNFDAVQALLQGSSSSAFAATFKRWEQSFPELKVCKASGRVLAPLSKAAGGDDAGLDEIAGKVLPDCIQNVLPRFVAAVEGWLLYGEADTLIATDFETEFLGSLRVQLRGTSQFFAMPFSAVAEAMAKDKIEAAEIKEFMTTMSTDRLKLIAEKKLPFAYGSLVPCSILVVPPGWLLSFATVGDGQDHFVSGVRTSFLPRASLSTSREQFEALLAKQIGDKGWLQFLLTLVQVEEKVARALPQPPQKAEAQPGLQPQLPSKAELHKPEPQQPQPQAAGTSVQVAPAQQESAVPAPAPITLKLSKEKKRRRAWPLLRRPSQRRRLLLQRWPRRSRQLQKSLPRSPRQSETEWA